MPELMTGIAAAGVVTSAVGQSKAQKSADNAAGRQAAISERSVEIEEERWDIWKESFLPTEQAKSAAQLALIPDWEKAQRDQYENIVEDRQEYEEVYRPIEREAAENAGPDYEYVTSKAAADVAEAEDRTTGMNERDLSRRGVDPSSGNWQAKNSREFGGLRAATINAAREGERGASFNRQQQVIGTGQRLKSAQVPGIQTEASSMSLNPNLGPAASSYGNQATAQYGQSADYAKSAGMAAEGIGGLKWPSGPNRAPNYAAPTYNASGQASDGYVQAFAKGGLIGSKEEGAESPAPGLSMPRSGGPPAGGLITGPGDGTSDSIPGEIINNGQSRPAQFSNGEYIVPAKDVESIVQEWFKDQLGGLQRSIV
jgi:hypothetical protein